MKKWLTGCERKKSTLPRRQSLKRSKIEDGQYGQITAKREKQSLMNTQGGNMNPACYTTAHNFQGQGENTQVHQAQQWGTQRYVYQPNQGGSHNGGTFVPSMQMHNPEGGESRQVHHSQTHGYMNGGTVFYPSQPPPPLPHTGQVWNDEPETVMNAVLPTIEETRAVDNMGKKRPEKKDKDPREKKEGGARDGGKYSPARQEIKEQRSSRQGRDMEPILLEWLPHKSGSAGHLAFRDQLKDIEDTTEGRRRMEGVRRMNQVTPIPEKGLQIVTGQGVELAPGEYYRYVFGIHIRVRGPDPFMLTLNRVGEMNKFSLMADTMTYMPSDEWQQLTIGILNLGDAIKIREKHHVATLQTTTGRKGMIKTVARNKYKSDKNFEKPLPDTIKMTKDKKLALTKVRVPVECKGRMANKQGRDGEEARGEKRESTSQTEGSEGTESGDMQIRPKKRKEKSEEGDPPRRRSPRRTPAMVEADCKMETNENDGMRKRTSIGENIYEEADRLINE